MLFFKILFSIFIFLPDKTIITTKTKVRSATLEPNSVPKPKAGMPASEELIDTNVSGRIEIMAMITKPTMYFDIRKFFANRSAYLVAEMEPLTTKNSDTDSINKFCSIRIFIDKNFNMWYKDLM